MSRTRFVVIMTVLAAMLLGTLSSVVAQGNVLTIWADDTRAPVLLELASQVESELGIELDVVQLGFGDIRSQLTVAGPVGEGPDILIGAHDWVGGFVENGAVAPINLSDDLLAEFKPAGIEAFSYADGNLYGIPYGLENVAFVRNTELVPEAPATWEEVRTISEQLQADGTAQYGFLSDDGDVYANYGIITAFGGYIFGQDAEGNWNPADVGWASEGGIAAAEWLSGMYADGVMVPNIGNDELFQLFEDGELGMFVTGPWFIQRLRDTGIPLEIGALPGSEVAGTSQGLPFRGAQGFMISAFSENQLLAEIFLTEYVATTDFMQAVFEADPRGSAWESVDESVVPEALAFREAGETESGSVPFMPNIPAMGTVWAAGGDAMTLVAQGEDPVESFNNAEVQIVEAIGLLGSEERNIVVVGSIQAAAGCDGDWNPACEVTQMEDQGDGIYTFTATLPAGDYEYKVAVNYSWAENYGADGEFDGGNITLSLSEETEVTFTYDDNTNIVTDSVNG